jgi:hypothetical protein
MVSTAGMGVQTMNKQSGNKATITNAIDKSKKPSAAPTKDELHEQELEKALGGAIDSYMTFTTLDGWNRVKN